MGREVPCGRGSRVCDEWGFQLGLATLPGGGQTACHDECGGALFDLLDEAGFRVDRGSDGRGPRHLFTTLIPPAELLQSGQPPAIVPDACFAAALPAAATARNAVRGQPLPERVLLFDVKTLYGGGGLYFEARARDEQSGAVAERAHRVNGGARGGEYGGHARELDERFNRRGLQGQLLTPVADRLASFTQVRGLVFGQYSEVSPDVNSLVLLAANALARKSWRLATPTCGRSTHTRCTPARTRTDPPARGEAAARGAWEGRASGAELSRAAGGGRAGRGDLDCDPERGGRAGHGPGRLRVRCAVRASVCPRAVLSCCERGGR